MAVAAPVMSLDGIHPVTFWQPGDPPAGRRFATLFDGRPLDLEPGGSLTDVQVAYETWGTLDPDGGNAVLVAHALTGDSHAAGPPGPGQSGVGWWDPLIGPGRALDTDRLFVVCPNVLGGCQGTTGPSSPAPDGSPYGSRFPVVTIRDQVAVEIALADTLGVERWAAVVGGSMGGMRALEWAIAQPHRVEAAIVVACGATATAEQIALCSLQVRAIRSDPHFHGGDYYGAPGCPGPVEGMGLARRIGHLSYRSEAELEMRFGRRPQDQEDPLSGGRYAVESYLDHAAEKLRVRFDPNSYIVLSQAMSHHDVGRGRGGVAAALQRVRAAVTVAGIDSDRLYPVHLQHELVDLLPASDRLCVIPSVHGHDGFLLEDQGVGSVITSALNRAGKKRRHSSRTV